MCAGRPINRVGVVVRPGGKILVGGTSQRQNDTDHSHVDPAFIQRSSSGLRDDTFGTNGQLVVPLPTFSTFEEFALDPNNGSIVGLPARALLSPPTSSDSRRTARWTRRSTATELRS